MFNIKMDDLQVHKELDKLAGKHDRDTATADFINHRLTIDPDQILRVLQQRGLVPPMTRRGPRTGQL